MGPDVPFFLYKVIALEPALQDHTRVLAQASTLAPVAHLAATGKPPTGNAKERLSSVYAFSLNRSNSPTSSRWRRLVSRLGVHRRSLSIANPRPRVSGTLFDQVVGKFQHRPWPSTRDWISSTPPQDHNFTVLRCQTT